MSATVDSVTSGPSTLEGEETLFEAEGIVFHFDTPNTTWVHCGTGPIQLLKDRLTHRVRFFGQRRSTKEVTGNHLVPIASDTKLQPNKGYAERSWVWVANSDFSDNTGVPRKEVFAVRFKTGGDAQSFKATFEYGQRNNTEIEQSGATQPPPATRSLAEALAMVGIAGTTRSGSDSGTRGAVLNHELGTESVPATAGEATDETGPA